MQYFPPANLGAQNAIMQRHLIILLAFFTSLYSNAQTGCVTHWSKDGIPNLKLDSILASISFPGVDSVPCLELEPDSQLTYQHQIDFYTEQLGDHFAQASAVNFAVRGYRKSGQELYDQVFIVQFVLPLKEIRSIRSAYGKGNDGYRYFKLRTFTLYKYVIKANSIYFISTQAYHPGEKDSFLDKVCDVFVNSRIE